MQIKEKNYNPKKIFKNGAIEWHSDDFSYDNGSVLKIEKIDECMVITFVKSKYEDMNLTSSVRLRNSGSIYAPFNVFFMKVYSRLVNDYDPECYQVHIEEYLYKKRKRIIDK